MGTLNAKITEIKGIGQKKAGLFNKLGLFSLRDLISYFPRAYQDRTHISKIKDILSGEDICIEAALISPPKLSNIRKGLSLVKFRVSDGTGLLDITYFNQPWVSSRLKTGEKYVFYGKVGGNLIQKSMTNPVFETSDSTPKLTRRITPVYRLTAGLGQQFLSDVISESLELAKNSFPEVLPESILSAYNLAPAKYAYQNIHSPQSAEALEISRRRLIFEELFILTMGLRMMKTPINTVGLPMSPPPPDHFLSKLPFKLTKAQLRVISDISEDISSGRQMNRLIQGDVGSGKTLVGAAAAWFAASNGYQTAFMVPTEILASQHLEELEPLFAKLGLRVGILSGSMTAKNKRDVKELIRTGHYHLIIGTHALITDNVEFNKLGLIVTDEQHRFGVKQRSALFEKGNSPHVLVMSATPIPRTLALIIYGDLDISIIDELPPGRTPIETFAVDEAMRARINKFIRKLVGEGRQVYIVCPLVDDPEGLDDGRKAVEAYAEQLATDVFPDLRVSLVHGKMPQKKKDSAMADFASHKTDILVSTTVIEVGINVPNATLMIVENAERFGLSQLHQLRGRVGRGRHKSYCVLFSESPNEVAKARLDIMCKTTDGFLISEEDLKIRGPGDFFGNRQHGMPILKIADLATDSAIMRSAVSAADETLAADPELSLPRHQALRSSVDNMLEAIKN